MSKDGGLRMDVSSDIVAMCFSAEGVANALRGSCELWRSEGMKDLHIDKIAHFLASACRGLTIIDGSYDGDDFSGDLKNLNNLYNACPKLAEISPKELYYKLETYKNNITRLKGSAVDEEVRYELASLCEDIREYMSKSMHPSPVM